MEITITFTTIIKIVFLILAGAILYMLLTPKPITYFITPSDTNPEFKPETREILQTSNINAYYNIKEVQDKTQADIVIELRDRDSLTKYHISPEYYPGTKKQIRFSLTWQNPRPYIAVDKDNWTYGVPESNLSLPEYRKYVIRHEFMHGLGFDHQPCNSSTAKNGVCPILYQATKGEPPGFKCGQDALPVDFTEKLPGAYIDY